MDLDFDFDFEIESFAPILLALIGAIMGWFTASGGFSEMVSGTEFVIPIGWKLMAGLGGGVIGWFWGMSMQ